MAAYILIIFHCIIGVHSGYNFGVINAIDEKWNIQDTQEYTTTIKAYDLLNLNFNGQGGAPFFERKTVCTC